jgi:DNA-repair protein XRCC3
MKSRVHPGTASLGDEKTSTLNASVHHLPRPVSAFSLLRQKRQRDLASPPLCLLPLQQQQHRDAYQNLQQQQQQQPAFPLDTGITEISGTAGAGKTQVALGLCVSCALQQQNTALYVSLGEGSPQAKIAQRLEQMMLSRVAARRSSSRSNNISTTDLLDRIWTRSMRNEDELLVFVQQELATILQQTSVGVIVLDSVAAMFRVSESHDDKYQYAKRSQTLFGLAAAFNRLSEKHNVPIICINQVSANFGPSNDSSSSKAQEQPALGLSWANCVNTSYWVSRKETNSGNATSFRRHVTLRRSSSRPTESVEFIVDAGGAFRVVQQS